VSSETTSLNTPMKIAMYLGAKYGDVLLFMEAAGVPRKKIGRSEQYNLTAEQIEAVLEVATRP
jgi:hypothetical protein